MTVQAGYLPFHYLVCNPLCPPEVLQAVVACYPTACSIEFAAKRLLRMESLDSLQAPHHFQVLRHAASARRYNIGRYFLGGFKHAAWKASGVSPTAQELVTGEGDNDTVLGDAITTIPVKPEIAVLEWTLPLVVTVLQNNLPCLSVLLMGGADPHHILVRFDFDV